MNQGLLVVIELSPAAELSWRSKFKYRQVRCFDANKVFRPFPVLFRSLYLANLSFYQFTRCCEATTKIYNSNHMLEFNTVIVFESANKYS
jgi:hypothetical protein